MTVKELSSQLIDLIGEGLGNKEVQISIITDQVNVCEPVKDVYVNGLGGVTLDNKEPN